MVSLASRRLGGVRPRTHALLRFLRHSSLLRRIVLTLVVCMIWSFCLSSVAQAAGAQAARKKTPPTLTEALRIRADQLADRPFDSARRHGQAFTDSGPMMPTRPLQSPPRVAPVSLSLLDEVGQLQAVVPTAKVAGWKRELQTTRPARRHAAALHLWLGEWELAQNEQPERARWHFRQALDLTPRTEPIHGLAAYDSAVALYYQGAYAETVAAFRTLLNPKTASAGCDARRCALWMRHAVGCAGYHAAHSKLGIPEPPRLDPECGIAALAACLQSLGLPCDKETLHAACRVTGEGSTLADLAAAGPKLHVRVRVVRADEKGLKGLPKPLVAYVERDHFVALVRADAQGVSYLCSDCGMWPGGRVDLTWKQWRTMSTGLYAAVAKAGTPKDRALTALLDAPPAPARVAYTGPLSKLRLPERVVLSGALAGLRGHVVLQSRQVSWGGCGHKLSALHCPICPHRVPMHYVKSYTAGSAHGDPVNLATGEEEYTPDPDLNVYNPHGPSVAWGRIYDSLRDGQDTTYQSDDFGEGWSQPYNVFITDPSVNWQTITQLHPEQSADIYGYGPDAPGAGLDWDIIYNGATVATSAKWSCVVTS